MHAPELQVDSDRVGECGCWLDALYVFVVRVPKKAWTGMRRAWRGLIGASATQLSLLSTRIAAGPRLALHYITLQVNLTIL